jgi:2-phospho-L-lactate guanylyltransferase
VYDSSLWAIIPVKRLYDSKQRLAHILSASERADLIHATFSRLLDTLMGVEAISQVLVISMDERVLAMAAEKGGEVLRELLPPQGAFSLNTAVSQAIAHATAQQAAAALILPADLPFVQPADVHALLNMAGYGKMENGNGRLPTVILSSDEDGTGTNALLLSLPTPFHFHYGKGSYQKHKQEAIQLGFAVKTIQAVGLQFDLDTESDWQRYKKTMDNEELIMDNG